MVSLVYNRDAACSGTHCGVMVLWNRQGCRGRIEEMDRFSQRVAIGVLLVVVALMLLAIAIG